MVQHNVRHSGQVPMAGDRNQRDLYGLQDRRVDCNQTLYRALL